jgi:hypothetical protein
VHDETPVVPMSTEHTSRQFDAELERLRASPSRIFMVVNMLPISTGPNCPSPIIIGRVFSGSVMWPIAI